MKYGIYKNGLPVSVVVKDAAGKKVSVLLRAGTKSAARRRARDVGGEWRKDGVNQPEEVQP